MLITDPRAVREMYVEFAERQVAVPCFCTENQRTTEAILRGVSSVGAEIGASGLPIIIAFTSAYPGRSQSTNWTSLGDQLLGAKLALGDIEILAGPDGPFADLRVMTLLDHGQPDGDAELLNNHLDKFSCVMYDCSALPFDENIRKTAAYVERYGSQVTIEGAVDEIFSAEGAEKNELCSVEKAKRFVDETGVDIIVPNLGTEHRSTAEQAHYHGDLARSISEAVGKIICLHGTSSLGTHDIKRFKDDGVIKVNIWTRLSRIGGQAVARNVLDELGNILDEMDIDRLIEEGILAPGVKSPEKVAQLWGGSIGPKLSSVAECVRRNAWVDAVVPAIKEYLYSFGYANFGK